MCALNMFLNTTVVLSTNLKLESADMPRTCALLKLVQDKRRWRQVLCMLWHHCGGTCYQCASFVVTEYCSEEHKVTMELIRKFDQQLRQHVKLHFPYRKEVLALTSLISLECPP